MDTFQLIKINDNQLLATLRTNSTIFSKTFKLNLRMELIKNCSRKITYDILNNYIKSGPDEKKLDFLKKEAYGLFNILSFFELDHYFTKLKKTKHTQHLHLILDSDTNLIPFEILHDGKDFLSDYIVLSRVLIDSKESFNDEFKIELNQKFSLVGNPSESDDINDDIMNELNSISEVLSPVFNLKGPFRHRNVNKVELINLLGSSSLLHYSGHYSDGGWSLYNDSFLADDIKKCSRTPSFLFSNSCGDYTNNFIEFINSFLQKGTKTIISSLGNLPSRKAAEFSSIFYKFFIEHSNNVGDSLFLARREMIKKYGHKDFFWCFYQIYGSSLMIINQDMRLKVNNSRKFNIKYIVSLVSFIIILSLSYDYFFNSSSVQKLIEINVQSNINVQTEIHKIKAGLITKLSPSGSYPISLRCDSISITDTPYFSLLDENKLQINQVIIDNNDLVINSRNNIFIKYPYAYKNKLLNLFFIDKDIYKRIHFIFDDDNEYSVYLRKDLENLFALYIMDADNNRGYGINSNELYELVQQNKTPEDSRWGDEYASIHRDYLEQYVHSSYIDLDRNSEFELIKKEFKFKNKLIIDINKALIN